MAERKQQCSTCRLWVQDALSDGGEGVCRRHPRVSLYAPGAVDNDLDIQSMLPTTWDWDWCGEWQAANPQSVDDAVAVMARAVLAGDAGAARQLADKLIELIPLPVLEPAAVAHDQDANDAHDGPTETPEPRTP